MTKMTEDNMEIILKNQKIPADNERDMLLKIFKGKEQILYENIMIISDVFSYGRQRDRKSVV